MDLTVDLLRHAESKMNVDMADPNLIPFIGGRQNEVPLSYNGEDQAWDLGLYALAEGIVPTAFYSSPAARTRLTHRISSVVMGLDIEPIIDDRLQELDQGEWTGRPRSTYDEPENKRKMERLKSAFAPPGGESMDDVFARTVDFLQSLIAEIDLSKPAHIWVHTHGVLTKEFVGKTLGWTHEKTYRTPVGNASLTRLYTEDGIHWQIPLFNQTTSRHGGRLVA